MKTYKGLISKLSPHQIYVFGSNVEGRHGKGAALLAKKKFGAIQGRNCGRWGQSYAITTKDLRAKVHPSYPKYHIRMQIEWLYEYARAYKELEFFVAYSGTGTNLNGYSNKEMAFLFNDLNIPPNMVFEEEFAKLIKSI